MVVKYKGQKLRYVKDFHGKEVLWILSPEQIEMPGILSSHSTPAPPFGSHRFSAVRFLMPS